MTPNHRQQAAQEITEAIMFADNPLEPTDPLLVNISIGAAIVYALFDLTDAIRAHTERTP